MVSVIIPTYNSVDSIEECLKGLASQGIKDIEIILVDSGSTDDTLKKAKGCVDKIINTKQGKGPAASRNRGAENAAGDPFIFVDSDVILKRDSVEKALSSLSKHRLDAVSGVYSDNLPSANFLSELQNLILIYRFSDLKRPAQIVNSAFCAIKSDIFKRSGGFNEQMLYYEDIELGQRLSEMGCHLKVDPTLKVTHLKRFGIKGIMSDYLKKSISSGMYRSKDFLKRSREDGLPLAIKIAGVSTPAILISMLFTDINMIPLFLSLAVYTLFLLPLLNFLLKRKNLWFCIASYFVFFFIFLASFFGLAYGVIKGGRDARHP